MAGTTVTRNLKLRIDSNLTANAKYNLDRIDALGAAYLLDSTESVVIRSKEDISIRPQDASIGGTGVGGTVSFGVIGQNLTSFSVYSDAVTFSGTLSLTSPVLTTPIVRSSLLLQNTTGAQPSLQLSEDPDNGTNKVSIQAPAILAADYTLTLPTDDGANGQVLSTDGAGNLSWIVNGSGGGGSVIQVTDSWLLADGLTKVINHGLNTTSLDITIIDLLDNKFMLVDSMTITDSNNITLSSSEAPNSSGWKIIIQGE